MPVSFRIPVTVEEVPGVIVAALLEVRLPVTVPVPKSEPPFRLTPPVDAESVPLSVVVPPDCVYAPELANVNVLPVLIVSVPAFVKFHK